MKTNKPHFWKSVHKFLLVVESIVIDFSYFIKQIIVTMGKKDKGKKKGKGAEKTALKTDKKLAAKQKKLLEKIGEVMSNI